MGRKMCNTSPAMRSLLGGPRAGGGETVRVTLGRAAGGVVTWGMTCWGERVNGLRMGPDPAVGVKGAPAAVVTGSVAGGLTGSSTITRAPASSTFLSSSKRSTVLYIVSDEGNDERGIHT